MKYQPVNRILETDFDSIVSEAGGSRIGQDRSYPEGHNADYQLNEAILELKIIGEEGLEKETRKRKIARLFRQFQSDRPVVVMDPALLSHRELLDYRTLIRQPIQRAVKKAARQIHDTKTRISSNSTGVVIILNDGYTALGMEEFKEVVGQSVRHDTSKIDYAIAGGIYYYSDRFDSYFLCRFDLIPINIDKPFPSYQILCDAWNNWVKEYMTSVIRGQHYSDDDKLPVVDLRFNLEGVDYVKPSPQIGKPSDFWPSGNRPRENSTGIEQCPPVATCFPKLSMADWSLFKKAMPEDAELQSDYTAWRSWAREQERFTGTELLPFVKINIRYDGFITWCEESNEDRSFSALCRFSVEVFEEKVRRIADTAIDQQRSSIIPPSFVFLFTMEIGQDMALDYSSIFIVSEAPGFGREEVIIKNRKLFFQYGLILASAYAVRAGLDYVVYERDDTYVWK